jgi:hypothetical protein
MLATAADLNHFYLVVDHETYTAIEANSFLKSDFAAFEKRTTVRTDQTYTAIYFYGTHTYFELFDASSGQRKLGDTGIAFGVDTAIAKPSKEQLITREWQGVQLPWFYTLSTYEESGIRTWLMQYHPDFLAKWHPGLSDPHTGLSREAQLRRYKAVLPQTPADPMLEDVAGITLACSAQQRNSIQQWLRTIDSRFPLQFAMSTEAEKGIREVHFKLRRAPAKTVELRFGAKSVLSLQPDGAGIWRF